MAKVLNDLSSRCADRRVQRPRWNRRSKVSAGKLDGRYDYCRSWNKSRLRDESLAGNENLLVRDEHLIRDHDLVRHHDLMVRSHELLTGNDELLTRHHKLLPGNDELLAGNQHLLTGNDELLANYKLLSRYKEVSGGEGSVSHKRITSDGYRGRLRRRKTQVWLDNSGPESCLLRH